MQQNRNSSAEPRLISLKHIYMYAVRRGRFEDDIWIHELEADSIRR